MCRVFVYGTLLSGQPNHRLLESSEKLEDVTVELAAEMVSLGAYPALVSTVETHNIKGEVYEVSADCLQALDYLEGHPTFYQRLFIGDMWVYYLNMEHVTNRYPVIEDGDWIRFSKEATERRQYG